MNVDVLLGFDTAFSMRLVASLLHFLWQGVLVAAVSAWVDRGLVKASAATRYRLQLVALAALALCLPLNYVVLSGRERAVSTDLVTAPIEPASSIEMPLRSIAMETSVDSARLDSVATAGVEVSQPLEPLIVSTPSPTVDRHRFTEPAATSTLATTTGPQTESPSLLARCAPYFSLAYVVCVAGMLARLTWAIWGGNRLRRAAHAVGDPKLLSAVRQRARQMGLWSVPVVAWSSRVSVPVVVGIFRPMILIPASLASGLAAVQIEMLITHELAHLRRWDPLINLLQRMVEAFAFFHPAVWYVSRKVDLERERASDDLVLSIGWRGVHYADALVRMAELSRLLRYQSQSAVIAASGRGESELKRRVIRILEGNNSMVRLTRFGWAVFLVAVLAVPSAPWLLQAWAQAPVVESNDGSGEGEQIGRAIQNFQLRDYLGKAYQLNDFRQSKLVVVTFLGTDCPLAKLYGSRLNQLANRYQARGVQFLGVNSNQQDTPAELGHYARQHQIEFPLLKDPSNRVADQFQAERTPEVFVLDQQRRVAYWGRIDDQFGIGYAKPEPKQQYLADALDQLLAGQDVRVARSESVGCFIGRVKRVAPQGEITYSNQISRIMQKRCVECHREGGIAPFALETYDDVAAWSETISEVIRDQRMPPWHANPSYGHFANDARMPIEEQEAIHQWSRNGVPRGPDSELPAEQPFVDGWMMGAPDLVLTVPDPVHVPATGIVDYQYIEIDPGFTEGKWIRASEIRPGVRSVVHHIAVFINPPGGDPILEQRGVGFETVGGYVPGAALTEYEDGIARYMPPGSTLIFQIHYTPDGVPRQDQSKIGLYFADPESVQYTMQTGVAVSLDFMIPPHANNHRVEATHRFSHDMQLHMLAPHMHYRGKSFRFEAIYPNGSREILLDVPRYDFNWQHAYRLQRPKFLPEGTLLKCVAYFDNSDQNLSNPDPTIPIRWGEQTWEEMMIGYFEGIFLNQDMKMPEPEVTPIDNGRYRVKFRYKPDRVVETIHLAGTFNDWNTMSHPLKDSDGDGVYLIETTVGGGEHRYKFVINGNYWTHDPASRILTGFFHESFFVAGPSVDNR